LYVDAVKLLADALKLPIGTLKLLADAMKLSVGAVRLLIDALKLPPGTLKLHIDYMKFRTCDTHVAYLYIEVSMPVLRSCLPLHRSSMSDKSMQKRQK
jgi:hypothetical protein